MIDKTLILRLIKNELHKPYLTIMKSTIKKEILDYRNLQEADGLVERLQRK